MSDDTKESEEFEKKSKFWMNLPPILMDTYLDLVRSMADMDTRASYLITFGDALSLALPQALEDYEEFKALSKTTPLPADNPLTKIPYDAYRAYTKTYEKIMRKAGMIGGINKGAGGEEAWDFPEEEE